MEEYEDEEDAVDALEEAGRQLFHRVHAELQSVLKLLYAGIAMARTLQPIVLASAVGVASHGLEDTVGPSTEETVEPSTCLLLRVPSSASGLSKGTSVKEFFHRRQLRPQPFTLGSRILMGP